MVLFGLTRRERREMLPMKLSQHWQLSRQRVFYPRQFFSLPDQSIELVQEQVKFGIKRKTWQTSLETVLGQLAVSSQSFHAKFSASCSATRRKPHAALIQQPQRRIHALHHQQNPQEHPVLIQPQRPVRLDKLPFEPLLMVELLAV